MTTHKSERLTEFYENFRTEGLNINYIRMDIKNPVLTDPPRTKEPPKEGGRNFEKTNFKITITYVNEILTFSKRGDHENFCQKLKFMGFFHLRWPLGNYT